MVWIPKVVLDKYKLSSYIDFFPRKDITTGLENSLFLKFSGIHNMLLIGGERSKIQRKIATPAFRRSMPVKLFGKITQDLFSVVETAGGTVQVLDLMNRWTLEAIGLAGFGKMTFTSIILLLLTQLS
jgi:cytochrome P450